MRLLLITLGNFKWTNCSDRVLEMERQILWTFRAEGIFKQFELTSGLKIQKLLEF